MADGKPSTPTCHTTTYNMTATRHARDGQTALDLAFPTRRKQDENSHFNCNLVLPFASRVSQQNPRVCPPLCTFATCCLQGFQLAFTVPYSEPPPAPSLSFYPPLPTSPVFYVFFSFSLSGVPILLNTSALALAAVQLHCSSYLALFPLFFPR